MECYKGNNTKKLFSIYKVYDFDKKDKVQMMHIYKRNLSPINEHFQYQNPISPFEDNFVVFSNRSFKQEFLNIHHDNVKVNSNCKGKNFQTFSIVQQKNEKP